MNPRYRISDTQDINLSEIGIGVTCRNARFVFDRLVTVELGDLLELDNGQWFLIKNPDGDEKRIALDGKWST
jgi:hypothetical protein